MSMKTKLFSASFILAASLMTAGIAQAGKPTGETHTVPVPTDNRCWGEAASNLAHLETGAMGTHSKSSKAPEDSFRDGPFGGVEPRLGVGNVSEDVHGVAPGKGGNGQHAVNNSVGFTDLADPVTGELTVNAGGTAEVRNLPECSTGLQPSIDFVP